MLKKMLVAAMAVMVLAVVVAPNASASWLNKHTSLVANENPKETFTGTFQYQGLVGKVHCNNIETRLTLIGGQTTATVEVFRSQNPAACHVSGGLGTSCGTNSLQKMDLQTHATGQIGTHNGDAAITIADFKLVSQFGSCAFVDAESDATRDFWLAPGSPTTINATTVTGTLKTPVGNTQVSGTLQAHIPGTIGIKAHS
jgi:hypothetical protein